MHWLWIAVASRWIHISCAIVLVGGVVFLRFVLGPAAKQLPEEAHEQLKAQVLATWKKIVHIGFGLFWVSGLYNYLVVMAPLHKGDKIYHMLLGIKILLALGVTFLASVMVGRSKAFEGMRANPKLWQTIILAIAVLIIGISGYAKVALNGTTPPPAVAASNQ